ncbi:hypothetical protein C3L23_06105 [Nautilia sp. PV-1]|uniref:major capsid protein n=1 Tax=Nautilia sp. PV-1 TaxID=2579250 RepID=UPI000FD9E7B5|nr:major capsid protein [Nautilia sp. PV-1]AZV46859.1 hypothetical protein C3L23_06105 [Nautilia sp. PV-1]
MSDIVNLFETRELIAAANQIPAATTFLQDTFFGKEETSESEVVDVVVKKGKRKLAPFVSPKIAGKIVKGAEKRVSSYKPAYIKEKWATEATDIIANSNTVFYADAQSAVDRAAEKLADEIAEHKENIARRIEWMAAQVLTTGKINVIGDGVNDVIDFNFDGDQILALSDNTWDTDGVDPIKMMREWRRERGQASGIAPNVAVMGFDAMNAFLDRIGDKLDLRRIDRGQINPEALPGDVTYWGYIPELATDIYSYEGTYVDENGDTQYFVDPKGVIYGSNKTSSKRIYGAIRDIKALYATKIFTKSWEVEDPSARFVLMQSAPLVVPVEVDAFMFAKVLA